MVTYRSVIANSFVGLYVFLEVFLMDCPGEDGLC